MAGLQDGDAGSAFGEAPGDGGAEDAGADDGDFVVDGQTRVYISGAEDSDEDEQFLERSDAGISIVREVFGFVKGNLSGALRRKDGASGERGVGKGKQALPRLGTQ